MKKHFTKLVLLIFTVAFVGQYSTAQTVIWGGPGDKNGEFDGGLNDWTVNPFKPAIKKNHLIGRGANDMKASIACFVVAVNRFKSKKFKGSISLLITGDEEGIAINGTKRVVEYLKRKKEKIDFCLVGEPTNQNKLGEMMKIGRRGSITGYLTVCGTQGHAAYPHDANNPAPVMTKILNQIENIKLDKGTKNFQPSNL